MRVALVTDGIWPYVLGGMQKHSYYLCKYLALNKIHVDLFHFNQSNFDIAQLELFSEEEKAFISTYVVDFPKGPQFPGAYIYYSYKHSKLIFEAIKPRLDQYSFIYTKGFTGWYLLEQKRRGYISCASVGVKFHGYEMFQKPPGLRARMQQLLLLRYPVRSISKKADVVFSYGGKITSIIRSIGVSDEHIFEMPSGVENSVLAPHIAEAGPVLRFLFLGRYERRKGIEELNEAIQLIIAERKYHCEFHFIGPIPEDKKLAGNMIIYHGEIRDKAKLNELIRSCDVLLCPSWSEGMPNSILEAMAGGLTVMATDVGAINVLVNKNTGWLIEGPEPSRIKSALEEILKAGPDEVNKRKRHALDHIRENFTWEKLILKFSNRFLK